MTIDPDFSYVLRTVLHGRVLSSKLWSRSNYREDAVVVWRHALDRLEMSMEHWDYTIHCEQMARLSDLAGVAGMLVICEEEQKEI